MNADEFVKKLAELAPSVEECAAKGYSEEFTEQFRKTFFLNKKVEETAQIEDSLVHLMCKYDTSNLEIGMVKLGKHKHAFDAPPDKIFVGSIEADIFVIDPLTGIVELLDHEDPAYVMCMCATSGDMFLDALFKLAAFEYPYEDLYGKLSKRQEKKNNNAAHKCAVECAKIAGVNIEGSIYETLLGYDSRIS